METITPITPICAEVDYQPLGITGYRTYDLMSKTVSSWFYTDIPNTEQITYINLIHTNDIPDNIDGNIGLIFSVALQKILYDMVLGTTKSDGYLRTLSVIFKNDDIKKIVYKIGKVWGMYVNYLQDTFLNDKIISYDPKKALNGENPWTLIVKSVIVKNIIKPLETKNNELSTLHSSWSNNSLEQTSNYFSIYCVTNNLSDDDILGFRFNVKIMPKSEYSKLNTIVLNNTCPQNLNNEWNYVLGELGNILNTKVITTYWGTTIKHAITDKIYSSIKLKTT